LVDDGVNGRLVPVNDRQALVSVMEQLIWQHDLLKTMGSNSLEKVREQFDWDRTVDRYLAVYDELLGQKQLDSE